MQIIQTSVDLTFSYKNFASLKRWVSRVIEYENYQTGNITIVFTSDNYLLKINSEYLNHDYYTDVITFDYSSEKLISGDIVISIDRINENSVKFNVSLYQEIDRVIIHGILHLLGYRDSTAEEERIMRDTEDKYLNLR